MKNIWRNTLVRISVLVAVLAFSVMFITLRLQQNELDCRTQELLDQIETVHKTIDELEADIARPFDDEYIAEVAHEELGLCFPQEIVFVSGEGN